MPSIFRRRAARPALTDLTKREQQAIDYITARGSTLNAFSISFDVSPKRIQALLYYNRNEITKQAANDGETSGELNKENMQTPAEATVPPVPPMPQKPLKSIHAQVQWPDKKAPKQAVRPKKRKTDRNALSARSGLLLSNAAIKAQARADAKEKQRRNEGTVSEHVANAVATWVAKAAGAKKARPSASDSLLDRTGPDPNPAGPPDPAADDFAAMVALAKDKGVEVPTTPAEAKMFLEQTMRLDLCRNDGLFGTKGEVCGYGIEYGENYGAGDDPLPPGALSAFIMSEGEWQTATGKKRKKPVASGTSWENASDDSDDVDTYERMKYRGCMSTQ